MPQQWGWEQEEFAFFSPEEDFWQNPTAPMPAILAWPLPFTFEQYDYTSPKVDEDFWSNPVVPVPASQYLLLPYLPDVSDDSANTLRGQPDEDFWINPVVPVAGAEYVPYPRGPTEEFLLTRYMQFLKKIFEQSYRALSCWIAIAT